MEVLLDNLSQQNFIEEIILFNNNSSHCYQTTRPKVRVINLPENIYVYESWNRGVEMSKSEYVAILNDDIKIPKNCFDLLQPLDIKDFGIIGIDFLSINNEFKEILDSLWGREIIFRDWGFGIFMVLHKSKYTRIPDNLKIWCGDDYIFYKAMDNGNKNLMITIPIETKMSSTSDLPEFDDIKYKDEEIFWSQYKDRSSIDMNWIGQYFRIE